MHVACSINLLAFACCSIDYTITSLVLSALQEAHGQLPPLPQGFLPTCQLFCGVREEQGQGGLREGVELDGKGQV